LLGNLSIYNEAIIWGLACSLAALFFAGCSQQAEGIALTRSLLGFSYPSLFSNPDSEVYTSLLWSSIWMVFAAFMGITCLFRRKGFNLFARGAAVALLAQFVCILSYFLLAQRYAADLCPFLIFCLVVFLGSGGRALLRSRHLLIGLVALSVVINSLATVSWLIHADQNVPVETRAAREKLLGRSPMKN